LGASRMRRGWLPQLEQRKAVEIRVARGGSDLLSLEVHQSPVEEPG
jgi:hypothetical protein